LGDLFIPCLKTGNDAYDTLNCNADGLIKLNGAVTHDPRYVQVNEFNSQHYTVVFNLFIFMQIFNLLNCRKIDKYNFFAGIEKNTV